jgi:hypothetical protein
VRRGGQPKGPWTMVKGKVKGDVLNINVEVVGAPQTNPW